MAELIQASVAAFRGASSAGTEALARRIDVEGAGSVAAAIDVAVPLLADAMRQRLAGPDGGRRLAELIDQIDPSGLADTAATFASGRHAGSGRRLVDHLLDDAARGRATQTVTDAAGLGHGAGVEVLTAAAWVLGAQLSERVGSPVAVGALQAAIDGASPRPRPPIPTTTLAPVVSEPEDAPLYRPVPPRPAPRAPVRAVAGPSTQARRPVRRNEDVQVGTSWLVTGVAATLGLLLLGGAAWWWLAGRGEDSPTSAVLAENGVVESAAAESDDSDTATDEAPDETDDEATGTDSSSGDDDADDQTTEIADGPGVAASGGRIEMAMTDPVGRSPATGVAGLRFDTAAGEVCYDLTLDGVSTPADGHIHLGPAGVKGGIVVDFGPMDNDVTGCLAVPPAEMEAILADLDGHYVELHDPIEDFTVRAQLSEGIGPDGQPIAVATDDAEPTESDEPVLFDPDGGGATALVEPGRIVLQGEVGDRTTAERVLIDFAGLSEVIVVDELAIVDGSPLPSGRVIIDSPASGLFATDADQLNPDVDPLIDQLVNLLEARPEWQVTVVGHTDSTGNEVSNLELSFRRAEAVRQELLDGGIASDRIRVRGAGSTDPLGDNDTIAGRALNRRIEFEIER